MKYIAHSRLHTSFILGLMGLASVFTVACSSDVGSGGGAGSASVEEVDETEFAGIFSVGRNRYSMISLDTSTNSYTMSGAGGTDTGTYAAESRAALSGYYVFTSSILGGTFKVHFASGVITLSTGSLVAEGHSAATTPVTLPTSVGSNPFAGKTFTALPSADIYPDGKKEELLRENPTAYRFSNGRLFTDYGEGEAFWNNYAYDANNKIMYEFVNPQDAEFKAWFEEFTRGASTEEIAFYYKELKKMKPTPFTTTETDTAWVFTSKQQNILSGDGGEYILFDDRYSSSYNNKAWKGKMERSSGWYYVDSDDDGTDDGEVEGKIIYDDGKNLEIHITEFVPYGAQSYRDKQALDGYISATYSIDKTNLTLTITAVSENLKRYGLEEKVYGPLEYVAGQWSMKK